MTAEYLAAEQTIFHQRREKLVDLLPDHSVVIISSASVQYRNADTAYPFRQDSNFYYLTGYEAPESLLIVYQQEATWHWDLFARPQDPQQEQWEGPRIGLETLKGISGIRAVYPIQDWQERQKNYLSLAEHLWVGSTNSLDELWSAWAKAAPRYAQKRCLQDLRWLMGQLRVIKEPIEQASIQKAVDVSVKAHRAVQNHAQPGRYAYELEAIFQKTCMEAGLRFQAYPPIVAVGLEACTLHHTRNEGLLEAGQLVLIDAGAEYCHYASDITRTFPVQGRMTTAQTEIYDCVYQAQTVAMQAIKPGMTWSKVQNMVAQVLVEGLIAIGLLQGDKETLCAEKAYRRFYPHSPGHWLGLDVHDLGPSLREETIFSENMIITLEPGLYIPNDPDIPEAYRGIGVRIEDDLCLTATGVRNLSADLPRARKDIEGV